MRKRFLSMLSFFLGILMLVSFCVPVYSVNADIIETPTNDTLSDTETPHYIIGSPSDDVEHIDIDSLKKLGPGDLTVAQLKDMRVEDVELHDAISMEEALAKGHVNRLWEQEHDLKTVIYQNKDGTKTAYTFSKPVKYVDSNGQIKDKSKKITAFTRDGYAYAMTENSTKAYFPADIENGVSKRKFACVSERVWN